MDMNELWVFGYGSLMWEPGFETQEHCLARLDGYRRSFCMRSIHHRGTSDNPGLVLALDAAQHASCEGIALRALPGTEKVALEYLRERELISSAYLEVMEEIVLTDNRRVTAVTYVIDRAHDQYCQDLPLEEQAEIIARSTGGRGPNSEYLFNTVNQLDNLGLKDAELEWLGNRVTAINGK